MRSRPVPRPLRAAAILGVLVTVAGCSHRDYGRFVEAPGPVYGLPPYERPPATAPGTPRPDVVGSSLVPHDPLPAPREGP